jgi:hypothetical protein
MDLLLNAATQGWELVYTGAAVKTPRNVFFGTPLGS